VELNRSNFEVDKSNYFINYNYSTADWVLFLDDDVIPDHCILDAYIGAIRRYPDGKVFVGL